MDIIMAKALPYTQVRAATLANSESLSEKEKARTNGSTEHAMKENTNKESKMEKAVSSEQTVSRWEENSAQTDEKEYATISRLKGESSASITKIISVGWSLIASNLNTHTMESSRKEDHMVSA